MLPKPTKTGPKYPRAGIDQRWLEDNPDADVPSRISDEGAAEDVAVAEPDVIEQVDDHDAQDVGSEGGEFFHDYEDFGFAEQGDFEEEGLDAKLDDGRHLNVAQEDDEDDFESMYY